MPSNGYCVGKTDLDDTEKRDVLVRFLKGTSTGLCTLAGLIHRRQLRSFVSDSPPLESR